jgi:hypothetical protein
VQLEHTLAEPCSHQRVMVCAPHQLLHHTSCCASDAGPHQQLRSHARCLAAVRRLTLSPGSRTPTRLPLHVPRCYQALTTATVLRRQSWWNCWHAHATTLQHAHSSSSSHSMPTLRCSSQRPATSAHGCTGHCFIGQRRGRQQRDVLQQYRTCTVLLLLLCSAALAVMSCMGC